MTFNKHLLSWMCAGWVLSAAGCDLDKSLGSVDGGESGDTSGQDVECTGEALICPDGTAVGRRGPRCEFAPCPGSCDDDGHTCPDGTVVGREGPNCEFAPCPEISPCAIEDCGPAPGAPNYTCSDGSIGGPRCEPDAAGVCAWTIHECEVACTGDARLCADGSAVGRQGPFCEFPTCPGECEPDACDLDPSESGINTVCPDGSLEGPVCRLAEDGTCFLDHRECESHGCQDDGMTCPDGTVVGREGPNCEFAPCPESCSDGMSFFAPATCPGEMHPILPADGCYLPCEAEGEACSTGGTCTWVQTNPCPCEASAETCCDACAADTLLCMP